MVRKSGQQFFFKYAFEMKMQYIVSRKNEPELRLSLILASFSLILTSFNTAQECVLPPAIKEIMPLFVIKD